MKELLAIQSKLKAPKSQMNTFGHFKYRSCEDILEAVKPLLAENNCVLTIADDIILVGDRIYVKATATFMNSEGNTIITTALAREEEEKRGMDAAQITGAASSYARKYALNGLFCIDDTKDPDATNDGSDKSTDTKSKDVKSKEVKSTTNNPPRNIVQQLTGNKRHPDLDVAIQCMKECDTAESISAQWASWVIFHQNEEYRSAVIEARVRVEKKA